MTHRLYRTQQMATFWSTDREVAQQCPWHRLGGVVRNSTKQQTARQYSTRQARDHRRGQPIDEPELSTLVMVMLQQLWLIARGKPNYNRTSGPAFDIHF
eukprot:COSAG02_NODE_2667_length_8294_cov_305.833435_2_plen_99_part_00